MGRGRTVEKIKLVCNVSVVRNLVLERECTYTRDARTRRDRAVGG